jgi:hypothetical protein
MASIYAPRRNIKRLCCLSRVDGTLNTTLTLCGFLDPNNGIFTVSGTQLASVPFTGPLTNSTATALTGANTGANPQGYSITAEYTFTSGVNNGSSNATINVSVPGPIAGAGLPLSRSDLVHWRAAAFSAGGGVVGK